MEQYVANPVIVDAAVIEDTRHEGGFPEVKIDGAWMKLPEGADARYQPKVGDYYVVQEDGYVYVNPKQVFERKYRKAALPPTGISTLPPRESQAEQVRPTPKVEESGPKAPSIGATGTASSASPAAAAPVSDPGTAKIADAAKSAQEKAKSA